jgi:predicted RNase H-like nuclease (RuvC/YqgF family)
MEIFRQSGVESAIRKAGLEPERTGLIVWTRTLAGEEIERRVPTRSSIANAGLSPARNCVCAQEGEIEPCKVEAFTQRKSNLQESITSLQKEVDGLKAQRKVTKRHILCKELPPEAQFDRLSTQSKHFIDTIKTIAYRAETAMAQILRQKMTRHDDARSLLRAGSASQDTHHPSTPTRQHIFRP